MLFTFNFRAFFFSVLYILIFYVKVMTAIFILTVYAWLRKQKEIPFNYWNSSHFWILFNYSANLISHNFNLEVKTWQYYFFKSFSFNFYYIKYFLLTLILKFILIEFHPSLLKLKATYQVKSITKSHIFRTPKTNFGFPIYLEERT